VKPDPDPKRSHKAKREVAADHAPRRLSSDRELQRISAADEREITRQVRRAEEDRRAEEQARQDAITLERRARVDRLVEDALDDLDEIKRALGYVDRATYRDLERARAALARLKAR
jgi:hypothetical protein